MLLEYFLKHCQSVKNDRTVNHEMVSILEDMASLPVLDARSSDEIMHYDKQGICH